LFIVATGSAVAQTALEPIAAKVRAQALFLSATDSIISLNPSDKLTPRLAYSIQRTFAPDGSFTVEWQDARYISVQAFKSDGTLVSSNLNDQQTQMVFDVKIDAQRTSMRTVTTANGKLKSDTTTALKPGVVLRDELQIIIPQAWLYGIRDGLKVQSLSQDGGMSGDFQILFKTVTDPTSLSKKYTYPEEFKTLLAANPSYLVADMSLTGFVSLFYPHHFYLLYLVTPTGLELQAYFGEDPAKAIFQSVVKS
jgi:hypothetical protein